MKFYRNGALMVMFANLLDDLAELFPEYKLKRLKFLLRELMGKDTETMMEAESMREILQVLRQKNIFSPKDVLTMQYLLRKTECAELCNKCTDYAKKCKALCFFENQPENGYKQARFHVNGNVEDYSKEDLLRIRDTIAAMLDCSTDSVSIEGLRPSESFVVVVAIKQEYINRLLERAQNILVHLCDLNVDYFECDGVKIYRQEWEEAKNTGESTENSQHHPSGIQEQKERYTIPVQCVSDIDEYNLASPLEFSSLLPPGPSIAIEEIPFDDEKHVQEKQDMEETKEKLFESCKITTDNDENETALKIVCQNKTEIDSTIESASLEDKEVTLETYEDRMYQNELAEPAQRGKNCIIIAPTGSGKTIVAIKIIEHHLKANLGHKVKKIAFVVDKNNLAKQQADAIKRYIACKLKVISGDTMREEEFTQLSSLLPRYDIFVITAQMLVNAMDKKDLNVESFTLLIFDECHHCHGGHSFYKAMVPYHDEMQNGLGDFHQQKILPQIVGLTASIGVGNAKTTEQTVNHVKTMMANLDADVLVSVQINKEELAEKINRPYQSIVNIPSRKRDEFGASIQSLMIKTEDYFIKELENIVGENVVIPPAKKGNEQYTQWLQDDVKNLIANTKDKTLSRMLHTAWRYLQIYNEGLIMHSYLRARDSLDAIIQKTEELPKSSSELEQHIKFLFENEKSNLQVSATDNTTTKENPLLLKLKDIIIDTYQTEPNMRGIIFVRTRELADILVQWMSSIEELKHIKAKTCTGANAKRSEGGMTKNKQKETIDLFRKGDFKLIVATTIVEEGLDIKECNLVVKYDYAGNAIAQIQAKGRGRADKSRFFILASEDKCVAEREWINSEKEPMMDEAMTIVQMEILTNNEKFQKEKRELQQSAKIQREAAASNKERKETPSGQYELRCLKCKTILCLSSEMRKLKAHYACVNGDFKNLVFFERSEKVGYAGDDIQVGLGKLKCKECQEKLGVVALYKEVHFPILQIKSLKIENNQKKMFIPVVKKWKTVEEKYFTVPSISLDDLQKISKTGKLLNLD
ncbi:antiviral innate immune response receptor RIG-I-like [Saccostrea echinata]|uniref:antiviral innate immune response receptor RIG-I-like n=1 Tax=Saccostrea echinata TaxID=191078 RepID=UPI002A811A99|nr:antiviral innate immune response receptor RIG-I-like [Saccostrea echinata]